MIKIQILLKNSHCHQENLGFDQRSLNSMRPHVCVIIFQLGDKAASLNVAELYVSAFANLAKTTNTVVLPASVADASSMVAQVGLKDRTREGIHRIKKEQ